MATDTQTPELLPVALACIRAGLSVVPVDHTTKKAIVKWKPMQEKIMSEAEAAVAFGNCTKSMAVVAGKISGGLLVLDFDVPRFYDAWKVAVGELADGLFIQRTGGGGYQVFLRCEDPGRNGKLAWCPEPHEETGRTIAIETRAEGGYAVVPPSLHPSGGRYTTVSGSLTCIPKISQAKADALLVAARKLDEAPHDRQELEQLAAQDHERRKQQASRNGHTSIIDAFNQAHDVAALLQQHGYTRGPTGRYIRPGGKSESVGVAGGHSFHWSTNDPLVKDGRPRTPGSSNCGVHDAFDVFAYFDHGGDVKSALKAAAALLGIKPAGRKKTTTPRNPTIQERLSVFDDEEKNKPPRTNDPVANLEYLRKVLQLPIARVKKIGRIESEYYLDLEDGREIYLGNATQLIRGTQARESMLDVVRWLCPYYAKDWKKIAQAVASAAMLIETPSRDDDLFEWISSLARASTAYDCDDPQSRIAIAKGHAKFFYRDGRFHFLLTSLVQHVSEFKEAEKVSRKRISSRLAKLGWECGEDTRVSSRDPDHRDPDKIFKSPRYWRAPEGWKPDQ